MKPCPKKLPTRNIIVSIFSIFISFFIYFINPLSIFELNIFDTFSRLINPSGHNEKIVIVKIDQKSIEALAGAGNPWPWPRQVYSPIICYLSEAKAVFVDLLFTEPSPYGVADDADLAEAINGSGNVYLPVFVSAKKKQMTLQEIDYIRNISFKRPNNEADGLHSAIFPVPPIMENVESLGNVMIPPDSDGIYRHIPIATQLNEYLVPTFVLSYFKNSGSLTAYDETFILDGNPLQTFNKQLLLRYYKNRHPFIEFSAADILNTALEESSRFPGNKGKNYFRDKFVFIGLTAPGLFDFKPTPVFSVYSGVMIHATLLDNLLKNNYFTQPGPLWLLFFIMLICLTTCWLVLVNRYIYVNFFVFIVIFMLVISFNGLLFRNGVYLNTVYPLSAVFISFIISIIARYAFEGKERRFIRETFSKYMDQKLVGHILDNPSLISPGGQKQYVTLLFADIAGFTTISESISTEKTARMLHVILSKLTEIIINHQGVIDKYIGDCIMAFWGAPVSHPEDEQKACLAALECLEELKKINNTLEAEKIPHINIRFGINSGEAIVGNLGSERLFDYTALGDTVNIASRLESINKVFQTNIIISEETHKQTKGLFLARELGLIALKGKHLPIKIYEVIGLKNRVPEEKKQITRLFNRAMSLYNEKALGEARKIFFELYEKYNDGPAAFYLQRCEQFNSAPTLPGDWQIIKMLTK